jgi:hypothetical protein
VNPKSDVGAKAAFKFELEERGYTDVRVVSSPADIAAKRDGEDYLFEIKVTTKTTSYFGAATITEWEAALRAPGRFRFVVARQVDGDWHFHEYSPEEFIQFSDIPPFKVYFRVPLGGALPQQQTKKRRRAVMATLDNLRQMIQFRAQLKHTHDSRA